jgi:hypothetical protein
MFALPLFLATTLVLGVFLLRRAYAPGDPTRGQIAQELIGFALVTVGVITIIASVTFLGR